MKRKTAFNLDAVHLIRFASLLWVGYLAVLVIINQSFGDPRRGNSETIYYISLGVLALICLGLSYWSWVQERLGRAFIPLIICLITALPILATWFIFRLSPRSPIFGSESSVLRMLPFLLVGFLLVALRYKWPYLLLIILAITGFNIGIILSFPSPATQPQPPIWGMLTIPLIQAVVFLAVGFSINYLVSRLKKQQESLEAANVNLTHYAATMEHLSTSRERNRLARELHDTLAHTLSGLSVQLETLKAYWDVDPPAARAILEKSLSAAHSGLEETRRALRSLRASPLDDLGLSLAIRSMASDAATRAKFNLDLSITDNMPSLPPAVEQCVYRVAQEAVANVVAHARAKNLKVKLEFQNEKAALTVSDDGVGFDPEKDNSANHFGLVGMKERAQLIGAELNITSRPGNGTTVWMTV